MKLRDVPVRTLSRGALCLGALLASASLLAQVRIPAQVQKALKAQADAGTWSESASTVNGITGSGNGANQPALPQVAALNGFLLSFNNGDHKLRHIGVLADGRFTRFAYADRNGDDPFRARAGWTTFTRGIAGEVSAVGGGKFRIELPTPRPEGHVLVLRGFEFRRADGTDANLRNISVKLDGALNIAEVSLTDDQGLDFRGLERTLGAAVASAAAGVPLPGLVELAHADLARVAARSIPQMVGRYRAYRVTVQYAWIPRALVQQEGTLAGGTGDLGAITPPTPVHALQGFEFTFDNSDHHLLTLAVNADERGKRVFAFQDNNRDDPLRWTVTYLTLKPELRR